MKANELRIGNYVIFNNFIQPEKTVIVDGKFLLPFNKTDLEINNYYQPIPLTEEWLLKFGFEKHFEDFEKKIVGFYLTYNFNDGISLNGKYMDEPIYIDGEYVHQLQNLYFALTGEDLSID